MATGRQPEALVAFITKDQKGIAACAAALGKQKRLHKAEARHVTVSCEPPFAIRDGKEQIRGSYVLSRERGLELILPEILTV